MKNFSQRRHFTFERLEGRRLLAADCMMQAMPEMEALQPACCEIASAEYPTEDFATQEGVAADIPAGEIPATEIAVEEIPAAEIAVIDS